MNPISTDLEALFENRKPGVSLTANEILLHTSGRGGYLLMILCAMPFVTPISIPGLSGPFGILIAVLAYRHIKGLQHSLPISLGERVMPEKMVQIVHHHGIRILKTIETFIRPRRSEWMSQPGIRRFNHFILLMEGLVLALPVPFGNLLPCYGILLMAFSVMEEDGVFIIVAYFMATLTLIYSIAVLGGVWFLVWELFT